LRVLFHSHVKKEDEKARQLIATKNRPISLRWKECKKKLERKRKMRKKTDVEKTA